MGRDPLRGAWLRRRVQPAQVLLYPRIRSTNDIARALIDAGKVKPPAIVVTSLQTAGHGQRTNQWWSDGGSLCVTFILAEANDMPLGQVSLRAGLAVASVVASYLPRQRVHVKWPNDVLVDGKKIAGLLCFREHGADVIGIGLNVSTNLSKASTDVRARATSIAAHVKKAPRRDEVLASLWHALLAERTSNDWNKRFSAIHALEGCAITIEDGGELLSGACLGIDHDGRLVLEVGGSVRAITSGTVTRW